MIKKLYVLLKKYKLAVIICLGIIAVGVVGLIVLLNVIDSSSLKTFNSDNYTFSYDAGWKINKELDSAVVLEHDNGSKLSMELIALQDDYKYLLIDDLIDEVLYDIGYQNDNFNLLYKEKTLITKNSYDGYKLLYENADDQVMVIIGKCSDKLLLFIYESGHNYFDMLLDSVYGIVHDFTVVEEKFDLKYNVKLDTSDISYGKAENIVNLLDMSKEYFVASHNYYVEYSVPINFKRSSIDSSSGHFNFDDLDNSSITLSVNIYNMNIYEYLDKNKSVNVYSEWSLYKNHSDYSKFQESVSKMTGEYLGYVYKNSYYYDKALSWNDDFEVDTVSQLRENVVLMYELDKNHIILFKLSSSNVAIPKELINMIKINSFKNYASYIMSEKKNGYIISKLQRLLNGDNENIEQVTLVIPDKYKEIDKGSIMSVNLFGQRNYVLGYNDKLDVANYEIEYQLSSKYFSVDSGVEIINNSMLRSYGEYKDLVYVGKKNVNGKDFSVYEGGYTNISGVMFTNVNRIKYYVNVKLLFYELDSGGYLMIYIKGNDLGIGDDLLTDLTNFDIIRVEEKR